MIDEIIEQLGFDEEIQLSVKLLDGLRDDMHSGDAFLDWQKRATVAVRSHSSALAAQLLREFEKRYARLSDTDKARYQEVRVWLYFAALPDLSEKDLQEFFSNLPLGAILREEYYGDVIRQIRLRLSDIPLEARDAMRKKIYHALHENTSSISSESPKESERGTIERWIRSYDAKIGNDAAASLDRAEFETASASAAHLSDDEKNVLKRLLNFYEFIKLSSFDPEGNEDVILEQADGKMILQQEGRVSEYAFPQNAQEVETAPSLYTPNSLPTQREILNSASTVLNETSGTPDAVVQALHVAINQVQVVRALGALLLLAQLRTLDNVLDNDKEFQRMVAEDVRASGQEQQLEGLKTNPSAPQFIARFLKIILQDALHLSPSDALGFGERMSTIMVLEGEKYKNIVKTGAKGARHWNL